MKLTLKQLDIVKLLAEGHTSRSVCVKLGLTRNVCGIRLAAAKKANGCRTACQLVAIYAVKYGIDNSLPTPDVPPAQRNGDVMHAWRESFKKHNK